ncbi:MAG: 50S ribosomal protein L25/general stress protein Ctc [Deltaproteobacteria bacterium]|nr:50S ribosomal protein L25/general stress protein Ctc [Deltaproteobacteria bacterium]MBW1748202.1 50S ribosomal protein L25/general stress protein Ctc [Deltaproteobacteria bacterium]MBW1826462.1 50S ribosomal protein L25/general stress protein Ctc [Deltaproteobacteria bacterium]MBW1970034.1 50S ribosomal protein L25/general stress protein Ctc [Deltaproteobacteria bacterium]MBW2198277.1 50S ribosomal protein L25/general stress protein Ctc [Deltaproteobacteria bacterium]
MELIELKTNIRTTVGNGPARRLREAGQIPAVLYGPKTESVLLSVNKNDFDLALKQGRSGQIILNLVVQNNDETYTRPAMIKELQVHPVSRNYLHIDFYEIDMDRKITVGIPIVTVGSSVGVERGGVLQIIRRELEVQCLPFEVPESIEIDVTDMDMGDSIHLEDISLDGEVEFMGESNLTVVTVLSPKLEEEPEEEEELEEEDAEKEEGETPEAGSEE